jgi:subfamily B ATP-binding cassette protein MsbA
VAKNKKTPSKKIIESTKYDSISYIIKRLFKESIFPQYKLILGMIFAMIVVSSTTVYQSALVKPVVNNTLFSTTAQNDLWKLPMLVVIVCLIKAAATYFQNVITGMVNMKIVNELRVKMYSKFIYSDISIFNNKSTGNLMSNMTNDLMMVAGTVNIILSGAFRNLFTTIGLIGVMFKMDAELAAIALFGVPIAAYPIYASLRKIKKLVQRNQSSLETYTVQIDDSLKNFKIVKSYNAEEYEISRMRKILNELYNVGLKISKISGIPSTFMECITGIGVALVLWYGGHKVMSGLSTPGDFVAFFTALMMAYKPMKAATNFNVTFQLAIMGVKRVYQLMDEKYEVFDKPKAIEIDKAKGDVEFKDVKFAYIKDKYALENISFKIKKGQTCALVGHSGGGKSTIVSLMLRFYDPETGVIKLDGKDIRDVTMKSLRSQMAYVGQDIQLFDDTILENIRYSKRDATMEEVVKAAKMAEADDFIMKSENGYETKIGQNGLKLSGGQRQRISIARALLKDAPILLLDEATSALDSVSEAAIQKALNTLMKKKTSIVIAHRLSTIVNADIICVVGNGKILETGSHDELLAKKGEYYKLYKSNFAD